MKKALQHSVQPAPPTSRESFLYPLDDSWLLYYPQTDRLLLLNTTAKTVLDFLRQGDPACEIASRFSKYFGISEEQATRDVAQVLADLVDDGSYAIPAGDHADTVNEAPRPSGHDSVAQGELLDCGVFRFGQSRLRVLSGVVEFDPTFFQRFQHRAIADDPGAETLEILEADCAYRLSSGGKVIAESGTINRMSSHLVQFLLGLEHPHQPLLAYCHAGAVSRGGRSVLMAGSSGVGKSTLTGFLVANGFSYLGDDLIAIGEDDISLLPLPTCLSIKAGSWAVLESLYPILPTLATINRHGRSIRYLSPKGNYQPLPAATAPSAIVFPTYLAGTSTLLTPVRPLQTMTRLLGAHASLSAPATEEKLAKFIGFVERTPAYELSYSKLPCAQKAIEDLLAG